MRLLDSINARAGGAALVGGRGIVCEYLDLVRVVAVGLDL
jgi:hypothetical protein